MLDERQLLDLKQEIEEAKSRISELRGQRNALLQQLEDGFKCKNIEQANEKLKALDKKSEELTKQINKLTDELEEKYGT